MSEPSRLQKAFLETARRNYDSEGELKFDDDATVSFGDDQGAYVQCWRWIRNDEVKKKITAVVDHDCMWCGQHFDDLRTSMTCPNDDCPSNADEE